MSLTSSWKESQRTDSHLATVSQDQTLTHLGLTHYQILVRISKANTCASEPEAKGKTSNTHLAIKLKFFDYLFITDFYINFKYYIKYY